MGTGSLRWIASEPRCNPLVVGEIPIGGTIPVVAGVLAKTPAYVGHIIGEQLAKAVTADPPLLERYSAIGENPDLIYTTGDPHLAADGKTVLVPFKLFSK